MPVTWFDNVELTVEAALSAATGTYGAWDAGLWGTATWGPDEQWTDISDRLRSISTERGFSRDVDIWGGGTATVVLLNQDGYLSPSNMASPFVVAGVTGVRPWRPIRIRATYAGVTYDVYQGYALDWLETWDPSDAVATVTVPCVDEWARLARFGGFATTPVGAGELSGLRVHRVLDNAGYTGARDVDPGQVTLQATDLSKNAADELKLVADSEGGAVYVGAGGAVVFERQYALMEETRSNTVQVTFVDANNTGLGLPVQNMVKSYGGQLLANIAPFQRVGGVEQVVDDATSRALYGDMAPDKRTNLICETDDQVRALATLYIQVHKDPEDRVARVVVKPRAKPSVMVPQLLARRVRDLVRVIRSPRAGGYTIDQTNHIAGISHDIGPDDWTITFDLSSAEVYQTYASSRWDVGKFDNAAFFF